MAYHGNPTYKADATVTVDDQDHATLAGVTVEIEWPGAVAAPSLRDILAVG